MDKNIFKTFSLTKSLLSETMMISSNEICQYHPFTYLVIIDRNSLVGQSSG